MKLDARRIEAFLREPGECRAALLYGDDLGLIRERATRLVRSLTAGNVDPFQVTELEPQTFARIPEAFTSLSLLGGRRVVRVRDVGDAALPHVLAALAGKGDGLLVLEAPGLGARAKLRTALERAADAVVIGCYPLEGSALERLVNDVLGADRIGIDADARLWLVDQIAGDQMAARGEIEKLALYAGPGNRVDLAAVRASAGDVAGVSLDDALFAATSGDTASADRALELAMAEGAPPVRVARALLYHLQRLLRARLLMADGATAMEAAKAARPPVFYRREAEFIRALVLWPQEALHAACQRVWEGEQGCKRTGAPDEAISRSLVLGVAQRAAAAARRER